MTSCGGRAGRERCSYAVSNANTCADYHCPSTWIAVDLFNEHSSSFCNGLECVPQVVTTTTTPSGPCAAEYEQCGGNNYNGPTCCQAGGWCWIVLMARPDCLSLIGMDPQRRPRVVPKKNLFICIYTEVSISACIPSRPVSSQQVVKDSVHVLLCLGCMQAPIANSQMSGTHNASLARIPIRHLHRHQCQ